MDPSRRRCVRARSPVAVPSPRGPNYPAAEPPEEVVLTAHRSIWRTTPAAFARLVAGLWLFGAGAALIIHADLGVDPWTVLAQGLTRVVPVSIGVMTILVGVVVLALWLPLRERPGLATVCNAVLIGVAIDATLALLPAVSGLAWRAVLLLGGIAVMGVATGLYLGERLGAGPRDGLMTGLHRRTGIPVWKVRTAIEVTVLVAGALLGGTIGVGTAAFALLIGPAVDAGLWLRGDDRARRPRRRPLIPAVAALRNL